jgi:hypothetical protein
MFFKQNAPQIPKKILKARYARAATQQAATRRQLMLGELFQAGGPALPSSTELSSYKYNQRGFLFEVATMVYV